MKRALALIGLMACLSGPARAGASADAEAAMAKDDFPRALVLYTQAVAEAGNDPAARASALFDRAEACVRYAHDAEALADYQEAITLSSDAAFKAVALTGVGDLHTQQRRYAEAVADYTQALALKPDLIGVLTARGQARQRLKDDAAALADFDAELKAHPKYPRALRARAQALGQPDPTQIKENPW